MNRLLHDALYASRQIRKAPGFALAAILTLALAITANSTIFSWVQSTLLTPIPGASHTSDLFSVDRGERKDSPTPPFSYLDLRDLQARNRTLAGLLGYHDDWMSLTGLAKPVRVYGALTTANYFDLLHVQPILGRGFAAQEEQAGGDTSGWSGSAVGSNQPVKGTPVVSGWFVVQNSFLPGSCPSSALSSVTSAVALPSGALHSVSSFRSLANTSRKAIVTGRCGWAKSAATSASRVERCGCGLLSRPTPLGSARVLP